MIFHTTYTYLAKQLPCRFVLLGTFCLLPAGNLLAAKVPEFIKNTSRVTAEGFIELVHELPNLVFVDSRMRDDRKQGFIEDSVSLPNVDTTCGSLSLIISKKTRPPYSTATAPTASAAPKPLI